MSAKWLKYLLIILLFFSPIYLSAKQNVTTGTHSVESDTITIASEPDYPPYCMIDEKGQPSGFSLDLFKAAAKAVGLKVNIKIGIWSKIKQDLVEGKIDALPLVGRTPEREELFDFTLPYLSLHGAVFVREGTAGIHALDDLKTKKIVVMKGDNAEEYVRRDKISSNIFTTNTFEEAFKELAAGNYDAVITQRVMGLELLKKAGIDSVKPLDMQLPNFRQDFCFAVQKGNQNLLSRLNEGLSIVIADKTFEEIRLKWFGPVIKEKIDTKDILKIIFYAVIPLLILMSGIAIIVLRREIKRQTAVLTEEIAEKKKTEIALRENEAALRNLSGKLEEQIAERTTELQEKVKTLDKSQQAMLYMVEDLNRITIELKEERHKLELSNKEMEAFSYSVSHDLRGPLRAIDGFSRVILEDYADKLDAEGNRLLNVICTNTKQMDRLITELLDLSRVSKSEVKVSRIDMTAMAHDVYDEIVSPEVREKFVLTVAPLPDGNGDPSLLRQVWSNLISNAVKFTMPRDERRIEITGFTEKGMNIYSIRDTGVGFNPDHISKLFGIFQRLHKSTEFEGTGVGLSIVQRIIHRHGGRVWAEGKINEGATFSFSLPRDLEKNDESR